MTEAPGPDYLSLTPSRPGRGYGAGPAAVKGGSTGFRHGDNNNNNNNNKGWGTPGAYLTLAVFLQLGEPAPTTFVARISNIGVQNVVGAKTHIAGCRTLSSIGHEIMALWPHIWRGPV